MEISKNDLISLSAIRLREAKLLLDGGEYSGAYYIAGYSVELALKACIAKNFRADALPDKTFVKDIYDKGHDLEKLIGLAGLKIELDKEVKINSLFKGNWGFVNNWKAEARYEFWDKINAITLYNAIADPIHGVLQWVKKYY